MHAARSTPWFIAVTSSSGRSSRCCPTRPGPGRPAGCGAYRDRHALRGRAVGGDDDREVEVFVRGDDGQILAGISGIVWSGYRELQAMWVEESLRDRGLARALVAAG